MLLRNVSPVGDLYISAGYGLVEAGATFAVKAADVPGLIGQVENFEPDDDEARAARADYLAAHTADEPEPSDETPATPAAVVSPDNENGAT